MPKYEPASSTEHEQSNNFSNTNGVTKSPTAFLKKPWCSCPVGWYWQRPVREHSSPWRVPGEKQQIASVLLSNLHIYCAVSTLAHSMYILLRCFAACPRAKVFMGAYKGRIQMAGQPRAAKSRLPEWPLIPCSVSSLKSARNTCGVIRVLGQLSGLDICSQFKKLTVFNFVSTYVP